MLSFYYHMQWPRCLHSPLQWVCSSPTRHIYHVICQPILAVPIGVSVLLNIQVLSIHGDGQEQHDFTVKVIQGPGPIHHKIPSESLLSILNDNKPQISAGKIFNVNSKYSLCIRPLHCPLRNLIFHDDRVCDAHLVLYLIRSKYIGISF